jgi:hypothetical protein
MEVTKMSKILDFYDEKDRKGLAKYERESKIWTTILFVEFLVIFCLLISAIVIDSIHSSANKELLINIGKTYCKDKGMSYYNSVQVQGIFKTTGFRVSCFDTTGLKAFTLYQKG